MLIWIGRIDAHWVLLHKLIAVVRRNFLVTSNGGTEGTYIEMSLTGVSGTPSNLKKYTKKEKLKEQKIQHKQALMGALEDGRDGTAWNLRGGKKLPFKKTKQNYCTAARRRGG